MRHKTWSTVVVGVGMAIVAVACNTPDQVAEQSAPPASARWVEQQHVQSAALLARTRHVDPPLFFIDGKLFTRQDPASPYSVIDPDRIASVQGFVGAAAEARAGMPAPNGVIWITTKQAPKRP
ncbi:MAG TPA: hypothetical protein VF771_16185 [Longimicrobiaceae bacterium]